MGKISILGGGPAGITTAYYLKQNDRICELFESNESLGGNARTFNYNGFKFDSGAHRFHDKDPDSTRDVLKLMGDKIHRVESISQIYMNGKKFDFPLSPFNLLFNLGPVDSFRAFKSWLNRNKGTPRGKNSNFKQQSISNYGEYIARLFLLGYSEKLWGISTEKLSNRVSGNRLKGLNIQTFAKEILKGTHSKTEHLDGVFLYPHDGYQSIFDHMIEESKLDECHLNSKITRINHSNSRIDSIEINGSKTISVSEVVSSLPIKFLLENLHPTVDDKLLGIASSLKFRNVILLALFVDKESISDNASIYFPDPSIPITRAYEPRNRSPRMSPEGKTSIVFEIPCFESDSIWNQNDEEVMKYLFEIILNLDLFKKEEVIGYRVKRMPQAYPILEHGIEEKVQKLTDFLETFQNLKIIGRNGIFEYSHTHDIMIDSRKIANDLNNR